MAGTKSGARVDPAVQCSGIDHVVLYVRDVARSVAFYVDILGMTVKHHSTGYAFLHCGDQLFGLFAGDGDTDLGQGAEVSHLAFNVPGGRPDAIKQALADRGIAATGRGGDPDCIYFSDPDGHRLQIVTSEG